MRHVANAKRQVAAWVMNVTAKARARLPQQPFAMTAATNHHILMNFTMPPGVLQSALPRGLSPDVQEGNAFVSVAIAEHEALRPAALPEWMGVDFTQVTYRAIVKAPNGERGVHVIRSDADSLQASALGNIFANHTFNLADAVWSGKRMLKAAAAAAAGNSAILMPTRPSAHFMLEPRAGSCGEGGESMAASPAGQGAAGGGGGIRASFDLTQCSTTMPATSLFAGQQIAEAAQDYFVESDVTFACWPWKDYWSSTACDKTRRTSRGVGAVAVVPKHPVEVDFLHLSEHASEIKFDSALYVDAAEYLWHPLEKHEFKAPSEAVLQEPTATKMYFDGQCPLCTKEVAHYKNLAAKDPDTRFRLVDINGPAGDPDGELAVVWGVTRQEALARIHVVEGDVLRTGIAGFVACWRALPYWKHLATVFDTIPYLTQVVDEFYIIFARWRLKNMAAQKPLGWEVEKGLESTASTSAAGAAGAAASNAGSNTGGVGGGLGSAASSVRGGSPPPAGPGASCRAAEQAPKQH